MGDNIHKSYKKVDPSYYQAGQDWSNYTQSDINYRHESLPQERMQYTHFDPNYPNYKPNQSNQNTDSFNYQNRQNEMNYNAAYDNYSYNNQNDQMNMMYSHDQQLGYNNNEMAYYNRDPAYYQARNPMVPGYIKPEHRDFNSQMIHTQNPNVAKQSPNSGPRMAQHTVPTPNSGMSPGSTGVMGGAMGYLPNMGYFTPKTPDARSNASFNDPKFEHMRFDGNKSAYNQNDLRYAQAENMRYASTGYNPNTSSDNMRYGGEDVRFNPGEMYTQHAYANADIRPNPNENMRFSPQAFATNPAGFSQADLRYQQGDMAFVQHPFGDGRYIRDLRAEAPDMGFERPYLPNASIFKPSLSFKEVATAMLSMDSGRKPPSKKTAARNRQSIKNVSKASKSTEQIISSRNSDTSQMSSEASGKESKGGKRDQGSGKFRDDTDEDGSLIKSESHGTIRTDPEYSKYRNRGLQQLTHYNALAQFHNVPTNYYNNYINQNMGSMVNDIVNNVTSMLGSNVQNNAGAGASVSAGSSMKSAKGGPPQPGMPPNIPMNNANFAINAANMAMANGMRKDWIPIRKINPTSLTPSARFFPPTPKSLSNFRGDPGAHKMNVVEEITAENELFKNIKKSSISSACTIVESFQHSYSNKRKRVKNCLVEDCRHVIGEQPKIDVQFTSTDVDGKKKYVLAEVLSTLLPYHLFYYDTVKRAKVESFDYSSVSEQIEQLRQKLNQMSKNKESLLLQSVYPCVKEGLVTCNELVFNVRGNYESY